MVDPLWIFRARKAWNNLHPDDRARLQPHLTEAHGELQNILATGQSGPVKSKRELLFLNSALTDELKTFLKATEVSLGRALGLPLHAPTDANGDILGFGKFQVLDFGWLEAAVVWLENFYTPLPAFVPPGQPIRVPDTFTLALIADWGTGQWGSGPAPSTRIAEHVAALAPEVTVHLGDVYYAGTAGAEKDILVEGWPSGSVASCTLNSNHEMYPAAAPYFGEALQSEKFRAQAGSSVFLLENDSWVIVGLDTAYGSDKFSLFMHGVINDVQREMLRRAAASGKRVLLLSHHNALCEDGSQDPYTGALYAAVMEALGGVKPALWYWGHVHCGVVYDAAAGNGVGCRCIGHGSLPWAAAPALAASERVAWHETKPAGDPHDPQRVCNGFAVLRFAGDRVKEEIRDENNEVSWRSA